MEISRTTDSSVSGRLVEILTAARKLNKDFLNPGYGYEITTRSAFDHAWGLGSSSALIANLSQWAAVSPFDLYFSVSGGSGYDVATALAKGPILYRVKDHIPTVMPVHFLPAFHSHIWFAYLGRKQDTSAGLDYFNRQVITPDAVIEKGSALTHMFLQAGTLHDFMEAMHEHESFLSHLLGKKAVRKDLFPDFTGEIKSLGAWGGDFMMIASDKPGEYIKTYFAGKGIHVIFAFEELVLL
jgi:mevalonate kinase